MKNMDISEMYRSINSLLAKVENLTDLIELSISFELPVEVRRKDGPNEYFRVVSESINNNTFISTMGTLAFQYNGIQYEIPYTKKGIEILKKSGFEETDKLTSRLVNDYYPVKYKEYWEEIQIDATAINIKNDIEAEEKTKKLQIEQTKDRGINPCLTESQLQKCFKVPFNGFTVETETGKKIKKIPNVSENMIGKISTPISGGGYSGCYTFVYTDGNTYITESKEVIEALQKSGFVFSEKLEHLGIGWIEKISDNKLSEIYSEKVVRDEKYEKNNYREIILKLQEEKETILMELEDLKQKVGPSLK